MSVNLWFSNDVGRAVLSGCSLCGSILLFSDPTIVFYFFILRQSAITTAINKPHATIKKILPPAHMMNKICHEVIPDYETVLLFSLLSVEFFVELSGIVVLFGAGSYTFLHDV